MIIYGCVLKIIGHLSCQHKIYHGVFGITPTKFVQMSVRTACSGVLLSQRTVFGIACLFDLSQLKPNRTAKYRLVCVVDLTDSIIYNNNNNNNLKHLLWILIKLTNAKAIFSTELQIFHINVQLILNEIVDRKISK